MKKEPLLEPLQQEMASLRLRPLKIVEEKNVIRVGGRSRPVDFRIGYAAHRDPAVIR